MLENATAQGEPYAMHALAEQLKRQGGHEARMLALLREASELGCASAQHNYATNCFAKGSIDYCVWLRRAAMQKNRSAMGELIRHLDTASNVDCGSESRRNLFEIGRTLSFATLKT